jgi:thiaminase/transcriptional activator TenA
MADSFILGPVSLALDLWTKNADIADACLHHPFVRGLAMGGLPLGRFRDYVAQDAYFLEAFARAYAFALARSPDRQGLEAFHTLIGGVLQELRLHASYAARWDVDLAHVEPTRATLQYTEFLLRTAEHATVGQICAAMTPCMRLYAFLGQSLAAAEQLGGPANPYREWIDTYASDEYDALAGTLEALLNRYADDSPLIRQTYRRAMQLELDFFSASCGSA